MIGHITLGTKQTGAPSAGNLHAGCDVAGAGNGFTVGLLRHSHRKRGATARLDLRNTAPVLDPTLGPVFGDPLTAGLKPISNGETSAQRGMRNEVPAKRGLK
jgi:hypothetical protein